MIYAGFVCQAAIRTAHSAMPGIHVGGVLRRFAHSMRPGAKVVIPISCTWSMIRRRLLPSLRSPGAESGEVAVLLSNLMRILIEVIDPGGVEVAGPALDSMYCIPSPVAVLPDSYRPAQDAGDEGLFALVHSHLAGHRCHSPQVH